MYFKVYVVSWHNSVPISRGLYCVAIQAPFSIAADQVMAGHSLFGLCNPVPWVLCRFVSRSDKVPLCKTLCIDLASASMHTIGTSLYFSYGRVRTQLPRLFGVIQFSLCCIIYWIITSLVGATAMKSKIMIV